MYVSHQMPQALESPWVILALGFVVAWGVGVASYWFTRTRPSAWELERQRREMLAKSGRIVDGSITETRWLTEGPLAIPHILIYRYCIAGVTYECGQDVRALSEMVRYVRMDLPVQVRFNPRNPGDSIVVAESWTGLRTRAYTEDAEPERVAGAALREGAGRGVEVRAVLHNESPGQGEPEGE